MLGQTGLWSSSRAELGPGEKNLALRPSSTRKQTSQEGSQLRPLPEALQVLDSSQKGSCWAEVWRLTRPLQKTRPRPVLSLQTLQLTAPLDVSAVVGMVFFRCFHPCQVDFSQASCGSSQQRLFVLQIINQLLSCSFNHDSSHDHLDS